MPTATTLNAASSPAARGSTAPPAGEAGADPQLVAEAKQEIRVLVEEIAQLAARDISPAEFYSGFLDRIVAAMAAVGGAVWTRDERGRLELACQVNLAESGAEANPEAKRRHAALLAAALEKSQAVLVPPASGAKESDAGNPTALLLVLVPLSVDDERVGLVEVFQRPGGGPATQRGYLRFLVQMGELAGDYLKSRRLRQLAESQALWQQLEAFVAGVHRSLDVTESAYTIVNEGRRLIGCDRVSLAVRYGNRSRIEAVSGLDAIDRRSGEVQRLAQLADAVLRTGEPLWSDGSEAVLPPQIERPLAAYQDQSHARLVAVLPLMAHGPGETTSAGAAAEREGAVALVGALIVEQLREASATESLRRRASVAALHSAAALANAIEHSSLPLLPLWKVLGRVSWLLRGSGLAKTAAALALAGAGVYALATVPTEFEVAARGKLQPAQRREIFAPLDGIVARVPVAHGQVVEAGAILAELASTDLELQLAGLLGRQTTNLERLAALERSQLESRNSARLTPAEENRLAGEVLELRQEAQNIERELALLRVKQEQLVVTAPQRGQVVTWKVQDLLLQRPVMRGQGLMTLANPDGPWELELYLPERRLKHVQAALAAAATKAGGAPVGATEESSGVPPLAVTFALSSHPGSTFRGQVVEVEQVAEVRGDEGNTVLLRVAVDKAALPPLHDQTTVTAKVHCGRTSIGYAWFCDLIETVQSKVLFWWPS